MRSWKKVSRAQREELHEIDALTRSILICCQDNSISQKYGLFWCLGMVCMEVLSNYLANVCRGNEENAKWQNGK